MDIVSNIGSIVLMIVFFSFAAYRIGHLVGFVDGVRAGYKEGRKT